MEEEIKAFMKAMIKKVVRKVRRDIWRENNKELYRAQQRVYDKKYYQKVKENNKEIFRKRSEVWRENNPVKYRIGQMKDCIKKKLKNYEDNARVKVQPDRGYYIPGKGKVYLGSTEYLYWQSGFDLDKNTISSSSNLVELVPALGEALGEVQA